MSNPYREGDQPMDPIEGIRRVLHRSSHPYMAGGQEFRIPNSGCAEQDLRPICSYLIQAIESLRARVLELEHRVVPCPGCGSIVQKPADHLPHCGGAR